MIWTLAARNDLRRISEYIDQFNPSAARHLAGALIDAAEGLAHFAERGRPIGAGRRELVTVWPYSIRFRIEGQEVVIIRVRHGARRPLA